MHRLEVNFNLDQRLQLLRMVAGLAAFLKNPESLVAQELEAGWDRPLADWQRQLGLPVATA